MTTFVIILVAAAAILATLYLVGFLIDICDESDRQIEIARVRRERRQAEARMNRLTSSAIQQMTEAAAPHGIFCQCAQCVGRGGQP
ncbi:MULTISPECIES: hypothetical protein [Gordonia]|uniref:Uncharacterized protein n=1 Tax=Gordonia westfalica TaxID=158898 RepID=A0A1H2K1S2_9ACTN|nr:MULTISPECIES: hypothetical protein [Gordonia]GAC54473.1 hypothetical protein GOAMI_32_00060 [Gordonia amicalis NBRC 100051 = JCM 11271]SDU62275.1 hypothetical protein SAMN04488548_1342724 [Gordonia westfalica]